MGCRAHIQRTHIIEYADCEYFNWMQNPILHWFGQIGVQVFVTNGDGCDESWEIEKAFLYDIPDSAYSQLECDNISADKLREFVQDLINADTGEYAYVDWF